MSNVLPAEIALLCPGCGRRILFESSVLVAVVERCRGTPVESWPVPYASGHHEGIRCGWFLQKCWGQDATPKV
jgi:hypothetical protein